MAFERLISPARECPMVILRLVQAVEGFHGEGVAEEFLVAGEASVVGSNCMGTSMEPLGIGRALAAGYITVSLHSCPGADPLSPPILLETHSTGKCPANPTHQGGVEGHNIEKVPYREALRYTQGRELCRTATPFRAWSFTFLREVNNMPRKDGTGPFGRAGSGAGKGSGMGRSRKRRMGGPSVAAGPGGECICSQCGTVAPHSVGVPCSQQNCPKCGATMVRR